MWSPAASPGEAVGCSLALDPFDNYCPVMFDLSLRDYPSSSASHGCTSLPQPHPQQGYSRGELDWKSDWTKNVGVVDEFSKMDIEEIERYCDLDELMDALSNALTEEEVAKIEEDLRLKKENKRTTEIGFKGEELLSCEIKVDSSTGPASLLRLKEDKLNHGLAYCAQSRTEAKFGGGKLFNKLAARVEDYRSSYALIPAHLYKELMKNSRKPKLPKKSGSVIYLPIEELPPGPKPCGGERKIRRKEHHKKRVELDLSASSPTVSSTTTLAQDQENSWMNKCRICGTTLSGGLGRYEAHLFNFHNYECSCGIHFITAALIKKHVSDMSDCITSQTHEIIKKQLMKVPFQCEVCGRPFRTSAEANSHRYNEHGIDTTSEKMVRNSRSNNAKRFQNS